MNDRRCQDIRPGRSGLGGLEEYCTIAISIETDAAIKAGAADVVAPAVVCLDAIYGCSIISGPISGRSGYRTSNTSRRTS